MSGWRRVVGCLLVLLSLTVPVQTVRARGSLDEGYPNPCEKNKPYSDPERCKTLFEALGMLAGQWGVSLATSVTQAVELGVWAGGRLVLGLYRLTVYGNWLVRVRDQVLGGLTSFMPEALRQMTLGSNGLLYLALVLAGLALSLPVLASSGTGGLVRADRVLIWGVVVTALFISGTLGYDLMGAVETLRLEMVQQVIGAEQGDAAQALVLTPMMATEQEGVFDLATLNELPQGFRAAFYPEPQLVVIGVRTGEAGLTSALNFVTVVESDASRRARVAGALTSALYALLALGGTYVITLFAAGFVFLGVAALVLMVYLVAALPLGFFEFGQQVFVGILQRYMQVVLYSLAFGVLLRLAGGLMAILPGLSGATAFLEWGILLVVLGGAMSGMNGATWRTMTQSFTAFSGLVRGGLGIRPEEGPLAQAGSLVRQGTETLGQVTAGALGGAVLGGGVPGAVAGGAAALLGGALARPGRTLPPEAGEASVSASALGNVFLGNGRGVAAPAAPASPAESVTPLPSLPVAPEGTQPPASETARRALRGAELLGPGDD